MSTKKRYYIVDLYDSTRHVSTLKLDTHFDTINGKPIQSKSDAREYMTVHKIVREGQWMTVH